MNAKAIMWLWQLKDLAVSGALLLLGFFVMSELHVTLVLVLGATYAFLTIRFEETSILDYLKNACRFCFGQQQFKWGMRTSKKEGNHEQTKVYAGADEL